MHLHHADTDNDLSPNGSLTFYALSWNVVVNAIAEERSHYQSSQDQPDRGAHHQQQDEPSESDHRQRVEAEEPGSGQDQLSKRISQAEALRLAWH